MSSTASTASIQPAKRSLPMTMMTMADDNDDDDDSFLDEAPQLHELATDPSLRCRYPSKHCGRQRTTKKTGALHSMCVFHRAKANRNQRRLEKRKRFQKDEARLRHYHHDQHGTMTNMMAAATSAAHYDPRHHPSMAMLPSISASSGAHCYSSPRDVDVFAHLEPFRTPVPLFKEDLEELRALVDFSVMGFQVSSAYEDEASQSRIV